MSALEGLKIVNFVFLPVALDQMPSHTAKADPFRDYNAALDAEGDIIAATNLIHSHQETMKLADRTVITQT